MVSVSSKQIFLSAILIAMPGYRRDSLQVVIQSTNAIEFVGTADNWNAGMIMANALAPGLIVVDTQGMDEPNCWQLVRQFKLDTPQISWCVITHTVEETSLAKQTGADIVLTAGFSTKTLVHTIDQLQRNQSSSQAE